MLDALCQLVPLQGRQAYATWTATRHICTIKSVFGCFEVPVNIFPREVWRLLTERETECAACCGQRHSSLVMEVTPLMQWKGCRGFFCFLFFFNMKNFSGLESQANKNIKTGKAVRQMPTEWLGKPWKHTDIRMGNFQRNRWGILINTVAWKRPKDRHKNRGNCQKNRWCFFVNTWKALLPLPHIIKWGKLSEEQIGIFVNTVTWKAQKT